MDPASFATFELCMLDDDPPPASLGCLGAAEVGVDCFLRDREELDIARRGAFHVVQLMRHCGAARVHAIDGGVRIVAPADRLPAGLPALLDALECEPPARVHVPAALAGAFEAANDDVFERCDSGPAGPSVEPEARLEAAIRGLRAAVTADPPSRIPDVTPDIDPDDLEALAAADEAADRTNEANERAFNAAVAEVEAALGAVIERAGGSPRVVLHRHHDTPPLAAAALLVCAAASPSLRAAESAVDCVYG